MDPPSSLPLIRKTDPPSSLPLSLRQRKSTSDRYIDTRMQMATNELNVPIARDSDPHKKSLRARPIFRIVGGLLGYILTIAVLRPLLSFDNKSIENNALNSNHFKYPVFNKREYNKFLEETLKSLPDIHTGSHAQIFWSGLNNQIQEFIGLIFLANTTNLGQIVENSITWKDTFGTKNMVPHHTLWDVVHWNSFYPTLPRFVSYDKEIHPHLDAVQSNIKMDHLLFKKIEVKYNAPWDIWENQNITKPQPFARKERQGVTLYRQLAKGIDGQKWIINKDHLEMYKHIMQGALRPHPFLQNIVEKERIRLKNGGKFMTLHARVEPDMARQDRVCTTLKVWNMTQIVDAIYAKFPSPPVKTVLIQFSRALMETEAKKSATNPVDKYHVLNDHNLKEINNLLKFGMWDGKVKVVEAGSQLVNEAGNPYYKHYSNIAGGIVNLFLAIQSDIFVGTEISTYSVQAANTRFYREERENYFYRPDGLFWVTPPDVDKQFRFVC